MILHILYVIALRSGTCLFERATVKTGPATTANTQQQLFTVGTMKFPSMSPPHRACWTSSTTLPEKKIAAGILNRQEFHSRARTGPQLNAMNWLDVLDWLSSEVERLFMPRTAVNKAACGRLATREQAASEGPTIALFRREIEAGQSTGLQSVLLGADSKQHCYLHQGTEG